MLRKLFLLIVTVALIGVVALTVVNLVPKFGELDFGDPSAHFTTSAAKYTLTVTVDGNGEVTGNDNEYTDGAEVTVVATPSEGYVFGGWESQNGDYLSSEATYTFTIDKDTYIRAVFVALD